MALVNKANQGVPCITHVGCWIIMALVLFIAIGSAVLGMQHG